MDKEPMEKELELADSVEEIEKINRLGDPLPSLLVMYITNTLHLNESTILSLRLA